MLATQAAKLLNAKNQAADQPMQGQKLLVISNKNSNNTSGNESSGDAKANRLQVSFNEVAPIFKIDKVPSNSQSKSSGGQSPN